ncbi:arsenate reductase (glutaredoxin) [Sedimenticola selenatireducens]|jgi:arsenate reductase|uniref:Arsenate reductase n=1 Tax=Sedimenticola selenatireducens TaxID=191960 RepID=A0A557SCW6_9GAMM|nr:arsenate reductase (glutaredoxin) [Sedimenticola selenatireducens]TVO75243.1 arsenate reductase (glutaredoxin) [Sedimenticola selenatireducens]TVT66904.1 MAG: arsenate reductase (glutaredoxin) [Sedimenticola selenatireducens]
MPVKIYHNPQCSKSRQTLQLLEDEGVDAEVIEYLKTPPSKDELISILDGLGLKPRQLMRQGEAEYAQAGLDNPDLTQDQLIQAMLDYPKLIERPIVVKEGKVIIGRPPERVLDIL